MPSARALSAVDIEQQLRAGFLAFRPHADQRRILRGQAQRHVARFQQFVAALPGAVLQAEIEAADGRQLGNRRHVDGEDHRLLDAEEASCWRAAPATSAEFSLFGRSSQSFRRTKAMAAFCPRPKKEKPATPMTCSTSGCFR